MIARTPSLHLSTSARASILTLPEAMAFCTSSATIRPSGPEPTTPLSEIPACSASFLAYGEAMMRDPDGQGA
jgi:hypothetical protein